MMNPINRRTLLASLGGSLLLPLLGCGGGKKDSSGSSFLAIPPTRGVGSFAWRTSLSLVSLKKFVRRTRHNLVDNTLSVITQIDNFFGPLTEYTLDYNTGKVLREKEYPYDSPDAEPIKDSLEEAGRSRGLFRMDKASSLTRLDSATQQPLWTYTVDSSYDSVVIRSPILSQDGTVYIVLDNTAFGDRQRVQALDGATGHLLWNGDWSMEPAHIFSNPGISEEGHEVAFCSEGLVFIEVAWIGHPSEEYTSYIGRGLAILNAKTGKVVRGVPLFDKQGRWRISLSNPLLSPSGDAIGRYEDSIVAMRTK